MSDRGARGDGRAASTHVRARYVITAAVLAMFACVKIGTGPSEVVAIEFAPLPWPSIVQGDSLRDSTGKVAQLQAKLYDATGKQVPDLRIGFVNTDTLVTIDLAANVRARPGVEGVARIVASGAELQSTARQLYVVPRPDSLIRDGTTAALTFVVPDVPASNTSADVRMRIVHRDSATNQLKGVTGWVVRWQLQYRGATVGASDTSLIYLVNELGRTSYVDTTDASGAVSRRVRFKPTPPVPALDSAIVTATATYKGAAIARSPLRVVLSLSPKP